MIKNGDTVINSSGSTVLLEGLDAKFQQAVIDDSLIGKRDGLIVKSIKYSLKKNGESTTVVLGKENGDVADELHN